MVFLGVWWWISMEEKGWRKDEKRNTLMAGNQRQNR
jgi:hypothetical protein